MAGIVHALTLLLIMLVFGKWATLIPLCVLASILVIVSYHMSEWRAFRALLKAPRTDVAVLGVTFLLTVFVDLTVAVEIGMLLSLVLFMKRMTDVTSIREITGGDGAGERVQGRERQPARDPEGLRRLRSGRRLLLRRGGQPTGRAGVRPTDAPRVVILRMRHVLALTLPGCAPSMTCARSARSWARASCSPASSPNRWPRCKGRGLRRPSAVRTSSRRSTPP